MNTDTNFDTNDSMLAERIISLKTLQRKLYEGKRDFDLIMSIESIIEKHVSTLDDLSGCNLGKKLLIVLGTTKTEEWANIPWRDMRGFGVYFDGLWKPSHEQTEKICSQM